MTFFEAPFFDFHMLLSYSARRFTPDIEMVVGPGDKGYALNHPDPPNVIRAKWTGKVRHRERQKETQLHRRY